MTTWQQQREPDFRRLKEAVLGCWSRLEGPDTALILLRDAAQQFVGWTLQETASAEELLQHLGRAAVLSPNAVGLLSTLCELVDCRDSIQLVRDYETKHPPATTSGHDRRSTGTQPRSAPAACQLGSKSSDPVYRDRPYQNVPRFGEWENKERFISDFDPPMAGHGQSEYKCSNITSGELDWYSADPSVRDPTAPLAIPDSRDLTSERDPSTSERDSSTSESVWRTMPSGRQWPRSEVGGGGGGSVWPPPESVQYGRLPSGETEETEESRQRSMALWGHAAPSPAPRKPPQPPHAVCECFLPHVPAATQRRRRPKLANTVEQVLDLRPNSTNTSSSSSSGGGGVGMPGVTPAGARRARLVDFLSQRLGARYLQLGEQLELVSSSELAALTNDTSSDLVTRSRRLLQLYLSRHGDGDVERALSRRLRRIRFNRLADELDLWGYEQDQQEDPRDWPEDKRRWPEDIRDWPGDDRGHRRSRHQDRHDHPSPRRIPRMTCCSGLGNPSCVSPLGF